MRIGSQGTDYTGAPCATSLAQPAAYVANDAAGGMSDAVVAFTPFRARYIHCVIPGRDGREEMGLSGINRITAGKGRTEHEIVS